MLFSKKEISEILDHLRLNSSKVTNFDINLNSKILSQNPKSNILRFLWFSKNEISEILVPLRFNSSNFSNFDKI